MSNRIAVLSILPVAIALSSCGSDGSDSALTETPMTEAQVQEAAELREWNHRIRREKFDIVLPEVMRRSDVDMWIHVMREAVPDPFGAEEFGSTSGVFVFTDRGGDRIERAILGRRWGASHAGETWRVHWETKLVEESGAYDILADPVLVKQPPGGPETEYDYRFEGLREFVRERNPRRIAVNFKFELGPYPTTTRAADGLSHTDYLLLAEELGERYANRIVSSEYVLMEYIASKVPSEIELLKKMRRDEDERVSAAFEQIVPGVTKNRDVGLTVFRRRGTGVSQRGRTPGHEDVVIEGGDIVAAPSQGTFAYVLREGETEPPADIQKLWSEYRKIDAILADAIRVGVTPREIVSSYTERFVEEGILLRDVQLHLSSPSSHVPSPHRGPQSGPDTFNSKSSAGPDGLQPAFHPVTRR